MDRGMGRVRRGYVSGGGAVLERRGYGLGVVLFKLPGRGERGSNKTRLRDGAVLE